MIRQRDAQRHLPGLGLLRGHAVRARMRRLLAHARGGALRMAAWTGRRGGLLLEDAAKARPAALLPWARLARRAPRSRASALQAEALLTLRSAGWDAAAPLFRALQDEPGPDGPRRGSRAEALLPRRQACPHGKVAVPAARREAFLPPPVAARTVVYTVCLGPVPPLPLPFGFPAGVRLVCFTDRPVAAPGWEVVRIDPSLHAAQLHKLCPHRVLQDVAPGTDRSLYVAPDRLIIGNLHTLFTRWLLPNDFALWRHPRCSDWHDLAERHLVLRAAPTEAVLTQVQRCRTESLPLQAGAFDTGVLWRCHADPAVAATMEGWWQREAEAPGADDVSLYRLLHGAGATAAPPAVLPAVLPAALGPADRSIFFASRTQPAIRRKPFPAPGLAGRRIPVAFLYAKELEDAGITLLRGRQLSRMIAARFGDSYDVTFTSDIAALRDQVVIVNRGAIEFNSPAELAALRRRNVVTISDVLDMPVAAALDQAFDAHMTLSLGQSLDLNRLFPRTPTFHVTHHVNPDVPRCTPPTDRLRTAYFGRFSNTVRPPSLARAVDMVNVTNATFTRKDWHDRAPRYNCHWIVREVMRAGHVRWKPFLKGFVAARCGAVVIVTRDDANAAHYLGDDYPFYAPSLDHDDLEMTWARVASAFGGQEWAQALDVMRQVADRSSDAQVCAEFKAMLDALVG